MGPGKVRVRDKGSLIQMSAAEWGEGPRSAGGGGGRGGACGGERVLEGIKGNGLQVPLPSCCPSAPSAPQQWESVPAWLPHENRHPVPAVHGAQHSLLGHQDDLAALQCHPCVRPLPSLLSCSLPSACAPLMLSHISARVSSLCPSDSSPCPQSSLPVPSPPLPALNPPLPAPGPPPPCPQSLLPVPSPPSPAPTPPLSLFQPPLLSCPHHHLFALSIPSLPAPQTNRIN